MLLNFTDHEGDPLCVLASAIIGLSVGTMGGPKSSITLIVTIGGTFKVAEPYAEVHRAWTSALGITQAPAAPKAHPTARGWEYLPIQEGAPG